jgi:hypothetical protein
MQTNRRFNLFYFSIDPLNLIASGLRRGFIPLRAVPRQVPQISPQLNRPLTCATFCSVFPISGDLLEIII